MINILHLTPWNLGGATSFTVNLAKTFAVANVPHRVVRLSKRTEKSKRQLGKYGVFYQNVSFEDARKGKGVWLLASAPTDKELATQAEYLVSKSGGAYVFHDPNEFGMYPHWEIANHERVICIRPTGLRSMPQGKFIPHPYVRVAANDYSKRPKTAVSIARISAVKNSLWILEANEKLPKNRQVVLAGSLNRFWWNFNVKPKHPDWTMPGAGFERVAGAAIEACKGYRFMVDLTIFKNDGGGTQYSLLEAIDAGAVPVMTTNWCEYPGVAKDLGWVVKDSADLVHFLKNCHTVNDDTDRRRNYEYLDDVHAPARIAKAYRRYLGV